MELWWVYSCSESFILLEWQAENTASGQELPRERSPGGFPVFWAVVPGCQTCGFRRNSSILDKVHKLRDSVRLNYLENFLMTLPSLSSETWEMYSGAIPGSSVFCDWLFLVLSGVSLETAANFFLFLSVAMILREKLCQLWRQNWFFNLYQKWQSLLIWGEMVSTKEKQLINS